MADDVERLVLQMSADIRRMEKALDQGQRKFDRTANAIERRQRELDRNLARMGQEAANFAAPVQAASAVALGAIVGFSINAAKRAEAVEGAFKQIFRGMPTEAEAAASAVSSEFGRLETDIKDNFSRLQGVLGALGVEAEQSLKIIDQLQRRSLDIAAFGNVADADAFQAVISGITGETEPLKRFGIVVNETATKAELLRLGFKGNAEQASEAAKAIARANIIMRQSAEMHGQVSRESDQLAEQEKRTRAEFAKAAEDFGQKFLPVAKEVLVWASNALEAFNKLPDGTQAAALGMLALVAASGPIAALVTGLRAVIGAAVAARAAIAAIPSTAGGAAGRGGVAPVVAGRGVVGTAAAGLGLLTGLGSFAPAGPGEDAPAQERLDYERNRFQRLQRAGAADADLARVRGKISGLEAEVNRQAAMRDGLLKLAQPDPDTAAKDALAGLGDFGLSDAQRMGTGSGGSGGRRGSRRTGPSEEELARQRTMLTLQGQIETLQAQGRDAEAAALQRQVDIMNLTKTYQEAGVRNAAEAAEQQVNGIAQAEAALRGRVTAQERANELLDMAVEAQRRQNDELLDQVSLEAELARLSGDPRRIEQAERDLYIAQRVNDLLRDRVGLITEADRQAAERQAGGEYDQLHTADLTGRVRDEIVDGLRDGLRSLAEGDVAGFFESVADRFTDRILDNLAEDLADIVMGAFKDQGAGGGGWLSSIFSLFGKRATGGSVTAGQPYLVGERRPEVFVPNVNGTVIPSVNAAMNRAQAARGGSPVPLSVRIDLTGANGDETIIRLARQAAAEGTAAAIAQSRMDAANDRRASKYRLSGRG